MFLDFPILVEVHFMNFSYWELLWRRARRFMVRAERDLSEGDFDGACFNAEQAIQLSTKASIYRLFGERQLQSW
jgi:HEPN domain-containing protein